MDHLSTSAGVWFLEHVSSLTSLIGAKDWETLAVTKHAQIRIIIY